MIGLATLAAWVVLLLAWGGFWRADQRLVPSATLSTWPDVVAVIPARDEATTIGQVVKSLKATDYPGKLDIIVVDDHSGDGTATSARTAGALVITAPDLPLRVVRQALGRAGRSRPCRPGPPTRR